MTVMWVGWVMAALLGLAHAAYVYRVVAHQLRVDPVPGSGRPIYFAAWTFALWLLLGGYVLILWLAGVALYGVFKAFR